MRMKMTWKDGTTQYRYMEQADEPIFEGIPLIMPAEAPTDMNGFNYEEANDIESILLLGEVM